MFYKTKPVEIEALEWKGSNIRDMLNFYPDVIVEESDEGEWLIKISTLEGIMTANIGDFIIKGTLGEYYPCKPEAFYNKYEVLK